MKRSTVLSRPVRSGENVCLLIDQDEYLLFHSPENGIAWSDDLVSWDWPGKLTE